VFDPASGVVEELGAAMGRSDDADQRAQDASPWLDPSPVAAMAFTAKRLYSRDCDGAAIVPAPPAAISRNSGSWRTGKCTGDAGQIERHH
jgi:hypothetical protein